MKRAILLAGICWAAAAFAVTPTISNVSISQAADVRSVTISYDLDTDAYVTLELRTGDSPLAPAVSCLALLISLSWLPPVPAGEAHADIVNAIISTIAMSLFTLFPPLRSVIGSLDIIVFYHVFL